MVQGYQEPCLRSYSQKLAEVGFEPRAIDLKAEPVQPFLRESGRVCKCECVREGLVRRQSRQRLLPGVIPEAHTPISWAYCPLLQT